MAIPSASNNAFNSFVKNQFKVQGSQQTEKTEKSTQLSTKAKEYLAKLKNKFKNVDFIVSDYSSEEEASNKLKSGKGEYNCIITPDLLEQMAAEDETASKYEGIITDATKQIDTLKETVKEKGLDDDVKNYGVSVDSSGKVNYYVLLKDGLSNLNKNLKADEKSHQAGKADKHGKDDKHNGIGKGKNETMLSAGSVNDLLKMIEEHKAGKSSSSKHNDGFKNVIDIEKNDDKNNSGIYKNIKKYRKNDHVTQQLLNSLKVTAEKHGDKGDVNNAIYKKYSVKNHRHNDYNSKV